MNVVVLVLSQLRELLANEPEKFQELLDVIKQFRDEEVEHHDIGLEHDAEKVRFRFLRILCYSYGIIIIIRQFKATMYKPLSQIIQTGCKVAIWLSQRV
jgi:ubiquinone biosynthesis monooxygenase Coq7